MKIQERSNCVAVRGMVSRQGRPSAERHSGSLRSGEKEGNSTTAEVSFLCVPPLPLSHSVSALPSVILQEECDATKERKHTRFQPEHPNPSCSSCYFAVVVAVVVAVVPLCCALCSGIGENARLSLSLSLSLSISRLAMVGRHLG